MRHMVLLVVALLGLGAPAAAELCCGDCNGDGTVTIDELVSAVNGALGQCVPVGTPTARPRFIDNGDGTVSDLQTQLMWEKKDDAGGVHDKDNTYTWSGNQGSPQPFGTLFTVFIVQLNHCGADPTTGFAGHCNWRLPSDDELQTLYQSRPDPGQPWPFDSDCAPDCVLESCSCTADEQYWTGTNAPGDDKSAQAVSPAGDISAVGKGESLAARAVRHLP